MSIECPHCLKLLYVADSALNEIAAAGDAVFDCAWCSKTIYMKITIKAAGQDNVGCLLQGMW